MSVTTFEGVVENGKVRLAADVSLPEKAKVYVVVPNGTAPPAFIASPRLAHRKDAIAFQKEVLQETLNAGV